MKDAKASYKKGSAAAAEPVEAPKKRRRKKKAEEGGVNEEEKVEPVKKNAFANELYSANLTSKSF